MVNKVMAANQGKEKREAKEERNKYKNVENNNWRKGEKDHLKQK